jgi:PPOX class probable F420-dependent enzyme
VADITEFQKLVAGEHGLVVVSTLREDGTIASSVVNGGVLAHPVTGETVVGMVFRGGIRKLRHLRERPRATVAIRVGWQWATAEGPADLIGPEDPFPGVDAERLRVLLREIFTAAGGTHADFEEYDQVMRAEGRTAVLVHPEKVYSNPAR